MSATSRRGHYWNEQRVLAERFPADRHLRVVTTLPADRDTPERLVSIGFEGSVLTRQNSIC